ncbi:MAG TPA: permease prefix domain 2-containing transporter [Candidatus Limnocylindrales bacterium]|nr:permease prefix domain 2-containing transporter [Candidatus Limnocylindrales bacterium]
MTPPLLARLLLLAFAAESEFEFVAGDLLEEFHILCRSHGRANARRWYWSQVIRSSAALTSLRMRHGDMAHVAAAAGFGVAVPLLLLDRLWTFVYSLIPLKEGLDRAPGFLAANIVCAAILAAACGATSRSFRRAAAIAVTVTAAAAFSTWESLGATPFLYVCSLLTAAPAGALLGYRSKGKLS